MVTLTFLSVKADLWPAQDIIWIQTIYIPANQCQMTGLGYLLISWLICERSSPVCLLQGKTRLYCLGGLAFCCWRVYSLDRRGLCWLCLDRLELGSLCLGWLVTGKASWCLLCTLGFILMRGTCRRSCRWNRLISCFSGILLCFDSADLFSRCSGRCCEDDDCSSTVTWEHSLAVFIWVVALCLFFCFFFFPVFPLTLVSARPDAVSLQPTGGSPEQVWLF